VFQYPDLEKNLRERLGHMGRNICQGRELITLMKS
jgi:hypothetical protein